jgi:hypothetical protein
MASGDGNSGWWGSLLNSNFVKVAKEKVRLSFVIIRNSQFTIFFNTFSQ